MTEVGPIVPEGTAAQRVKPKAQQELTPETQAELAAFRKSAKAAAVPSAAALTPHAPPKGELVISAAPLPDVTQSVVIRIWDGREVELGPPAVPHMLVIPKMFDDRTHEGIQLLSEMRTAKVFQFIRRIGDERLPGFIATWPECVRLAHELGEFGVRAVYDAYEMYFPEFTGSMWVEVKKNVLRSELSTDGGAG